MGDDFTMTIQTQTLSSAEHDWFATRSGLDANAPLADHKAKYFSDKGFGSNASIHKPLGQMESEWLGSLTGVSSSNYADQWREAVAGQSLTPGGSVDADKFIFYTSVATSP
jgi:hypothetical protein